MTKITTVRGLDLYKGTDPSKNFKPWYAIVPSGSPAPTTGVYSPELIAKQKKINVAFFFLES